MSARVVMKTTRARPRPIAPTKAIPRNLRNEKIDPEHDRVDAVDNLLLRRERRHGLFAGDAGSSRDEDEAVAAVAQFRDHAMERVDGRGAVAAGIVEQDGIAFTVPTCSRMERAISSPVRRILLPAPIGSPERPVLGIDRTCPRYV